MWVDHAEVKWGVDLVRVGNGDEDCAVDGWVALEGLDIWEELASAITVDVADTYLAGGRWRS